MAERSTKPYLIRAIHEWCSDSNLTPYITVQVDTNTRVPTEHIKNGEIVLNVSYDATHRLKIGDESIQFAARFKLDNVAWLFSQVQWRVARVLCADYRGHGNFCEGKWPGHVFPA